mgnify:CR=1 FL=1
MQVRVTQPSIAVSLVSHGHGELVLQALHALSASVREVQVSLRVWLTLNLPEPALQSAVKECDWPFELTQMDNPHPLGFGANHNQAYALSRAVEGGSDWFVVIKTTVANSSAVMVYEDGNGHEHARQTIPYTDFPMHAISLFACWDGEHWVIMLPSEY